MHQNHLRCSLKIQILESNPSPIEQSPREQARAYVFDASQMSPDALRLRKELAESFGFHTSL